MKFLGFLLLNKKWLIAFAMSVISFNSFAEFPGIIDSNQTTSGTTNDDIFAETREFECDDISVLITKQGVGRRMTIIKGGEVIASEDGIMPTTMFNDIKNVIFYAETSLLMKGRMYFFTELTTKAAVQVPHEPLKMNFYYKLAVSYFDSAIQAKAGKLIDCTEVTSKK